MIEYIKSSLEDSIVLKSAFLNNSQEIAKLETIGELLYNTLIGGHKLLLCGNGGSAADAQHIAAEFVGRFLCERMALPAIALTTDTSILTAVSNDYGYDHIFERQIDALGREGDILLALSTSGNSDNIKLALERAKSNGITTIGLLGKDGGICKELCDYSFVINSPYSARIQELHITIGHILCGIVDKKIVNNG